MDNRERANQLFERIIRQPNELNTLRIFSMLYGHMLDRFTENDLNILERDINNLENKKEE